MNGTATTSGEAVSAKSKVVLVVPSLQAGGAERVLSIMANYWAGSEWEITILTFEPADQVPFFELDSAIRCIPLDLSRQSSGTFSGIWNNIWRFLVLRRALRQARPDAVISFLTETNILTLVASRWLGIPVIVAERTDPFRCPLSKPWSALRSLTYRWAHYIVVQTREAKSFFSDTLQRRIKIIPNPVMPQQCLDTVEQGHGRENSVLAVGRLGTEKGYDLLLRAFAAVAPQHSAWKMIIVGDGLERDGLEHLADELGIRSLVAFEGVVANPSSFFHSAGIFVLSSRYEGFPMALGEAMASGCAVVAAEYNASVYDLIRPDENGMVVPREDAGALSEALRVLMSDAALRTRLGNAARDITKVYGVEQVMTVWNGLIEEAGSRFGRA